jgi:hypothetical protein
MPKICYIPKKFNPEHQSLITRANEIITDYHEQGYDLTLRQVYYQMVARDIIPNNMKSYKRLGGIIDDARLAGVIDWTAIVDRTRNLRSLSHWEEPSEIIKSAASSYRIDKWETQTYRPEVWVEKDALVGVIGQVCERWDIPYFSCRGYTSSSEMWAASQRLQRHTKRKQTPIIFHLGDHDPSGKDMTRDIDDRLRLFMGGMAVDRLALNMDQVENYNPPPNPAKITDSRARAYILEFGDDSWELDALEPSVIDSLIEDNIKAILDEEDWNDACAQEESAREHLDNAASRWDEVVEMLAA